MGFECRKRRGMIPSASRIEPFGFVTGNRGAFLSARQRSGLSGIAECIPPDNENGVLAACGYTSGGACRNGGRSGNRRVSAMGFMKYPGAERRASDMRAGLQSGPSCRCRIEGKAGLAFR